MPAARLASVDSPGVWVRKLTTSGMREATLDAWSIRPKANACRGRNRPDQ
jgi:hypothetical protein